MDIKFPPIEEENAKLEHIEYNAVVDGETIDCAITYEAMYDHYEAEYSDPLFAFMTARSTIEGLTATMIKDGRVQDNKLVINTKDVSDYNS